MTKKSIKEEESIFWTIYELVFPKKPLISKKLLVLDLDETLIHSTTRSSLPTSSSWNLQPSLRMEVFINQHPCLYYVYKRPHVDLFLSTVSKWYTVYDPRYDLAIFTASMKEYANPVIDFLEKEAGITFLKGGRFFREDCDIIWNRASSVTSSFSASGNAESNSEAFKLNEAGPREMDVEELTFKKVQGDPLIPHYQKNLLIPLRTWLYQIENPEPPQSPLQHAVFPFSSMKQPLSQLPPLNILSISDQLEELEKNKVHLKDVMLIDNLPTSFAPRQQKNGIWIEGWTNDPSDEQLLDLIPFLDAMRFVQNVQNIIGLRVSV